MSFVDSSNTLSAIGAAAGVPELNPAKIPQNVRDGNATARAAYTEGLAFEEVLVNQLTEQLANTMSGSSDSGEGSDASAGGEGSGGGAEGSSGGMLSGAASGFASLIPQALSGSIMDGGGLGIAEEFAQAIDPAMVQGQSAPARAAAPASGPAPVPEPSVPDGSKSGGVGL